MAVSGSNAELLILNRGPVGAANNGIHAILLAHSCCGSALRFLGVVYCAGWFSIYGLAFIDAGAWGRAGHTLRAKLTAQQLDQACS